MTHAGLPRPCSRWGARAWAGATCRRRVYVRFARWHESGVWERAAHWLMAHRRHLPHARQRQGSSTRPARGGRTSKRHSSGDGAGNVPNWCLTPGQASDCLQAAWLLSPHLAPACDSDALRGLIAAVGALAVIPPNPQRRQPVQFVPAPTPRATTSNRPSTSSNSTGALPPATTNSTLLSMPSFTHASFPFALTENTP